jgi:hypothetical protein
MRAAEALSAAKGRNLGWCFPSDVLANSLLGLDGLDYQLVAQESLVHFHQIQRAMPFPRVSLSRATPFREELQSFEPCEGDLNWCSSVLAM